ncbi:hypothetical protein [Thermocoleostomius sinensis]|jgi:hypothetical protein|uniref:Conjugal transfer protein TrbI n=1 Tax=Thermocoleostomius sinensis A174 TaxID=2016057 RepID=A0A9E8ZEL7_9CYAN|nr:hypothetical protein [Thermocoleostomius sinensis]WAL61944.1 hypothetical protein OXH18_08155 [Thermocoleostomius sinensis A174]
MLSSKAWQSRTALFLALGFTSTLALPLTFTESGVASPSPYLVGQRFPDSWRSSLPAGTPIPVRYENDDADRILVTPDETASVTLIVTRDIVNSSRRVVIPRDSEITGELRPARGGTQFVAESITLPNGTNRRIDAVSNIVTETDVISRRDNPDILRGAVVGAAAGAILGEIFGRIDFLEVLAGAGVGVLAEIFLLRNRREVEVVVVRPNELDVRLQSDFTLN